MILIKLIAVWLIGCCMVMGGIDALEWPDEPGDAMVVVIFWPIALPFAFFYWFGYELTRQTKSLIDLVKAL
ncbi:hypothetical protein [Methylobacter sp.]|uniref:hypothetical protein n=1 Tax=Methylobacter sp. TaxID=2051955 RepID=UPI00122AE31E|nr:hypothetical protein [Methylobacter sp.]TAK59502.1 MAG: hypothetical protein EPO18_20280 [Methylobacter sp.]